ncbi:hypothetical protein P0F65_06205 [Sphingomonas sp. I4]
MRLDGPFRASVTGWRFRHMLLFDRHLSGMAHAREERVQADGFDHIVLHHVLSGSLTGDHAAGSSGRGPATSCSSTRGAATGPRRAIWI